MNLYLAWKRFRDRRRTTFLSRLACLLKILINGMVLADEIFIIKESLFCGFDDSVFLLANLCIYLIYKLIILLEQ